MSILRSGREEDTDFKEMILFLFGQWENFGSFHKEGGVNGGGGWGEVHLFCIVGLWTVTFL